MADAGNARIQRIDSEMNAVAAYPVEEWQDLDPANRPDLEALPDGRLLVGDPAHGRILLLGRTGRVVAALDAVLGEPLAYPRGLAYDAGGEFVFASEGTADRVRRFPLSDFALR